MNTNELFQIEQIVKKYYNKNKKIIAFDRVPVSGKVYDSCELINLVKASLEGWWTEGVWCELFENKIKNFLECPFCASVNSGSSANLIALKTLTSVKLKERRVRPGDEIITVAAGFPTTVNAIVEIGAIPVFVDINLGTYNARVEEIEKAINKKTKAIFLAHSLGNPFDLQEVSELCKENKLWLIEDNCDAFGSKYHNKFTGTFGELSTLSFYPAHHITTAEGGAVLTNDPLLYKIVKSFRDWGRDCWCSTGKDGTCQKRYGWQLGKLPYGYDHKYIYSEIGFNLKMTDLQAAIGVAQMDKLPSFIKKRRENFEYLLGRFTKLEKYFILPQATKMSEPSWFGFLLTIKDKCINRTKLLKYLETKNIGTRLLFGGNITRQPYFIDNKIKYKQIGDLRNTDVVVDDTFWLGVYPGLKKQHLDYVYEMFHDFIKGKENEKESK